MSLIKWIVPLLGYSIGDNNKDEMSTPFLSN